MHKIQRLILRNLLFRERARFAQLNREKISNDHFNFHLKRLVEQGLVEKEGGFYILTPKGKEYANRLDTEDREAKLEEQAKISVVVVGERKLRGREGEYLIQQRLKQPYYGFYGFISGKVKWGEKVSQAAARELKEETNLTGKLKLMAIEHKTDYSFKGELLEDKYFFIFLASSLLGNLKEEFEGGKNIWMSKSKVQELPEVFGDVSLVLEIVSKEKRGLIFFERDYEVSRY